MNAEIHQRKLDNNRCINGNNHFNATIAKFVRILTMMGRKMERSSSCFLKSRVDLPSKVREYFPLSFST